MPVQGLTREAITDSVGYNLMGAGYISSITTSAGGDTSSVIDVLLEPLADYFNGRWMASTSGTNDGEITRVLDGDAAGDLTVSPVFGATVPLAMGYQLWKTEYPPRMIYGFINDSITRLLRKFYNSEEDQSLHLDGKTARLDIPAAFDMLQYIYFRSLFRALEISAMEAVFDETTDSDLVQTADTKQKQLGNSSLKIDVAVSATAGDFITVAIDTKDISSYTHLEGKVRCTKTLAAAEWLVRLDNATVQGDATDLEILSVPAVGTADLWTHFSIALANAESDTGIISLGLDLAVFAGVAYTIWFDDFRVVEQDTAIWTEIPRNTWWIDHEQRDLIFKSSAIASVDYSLLKLVGGGLPVLLNANSTVSEVDEYYIIAWVTAMALAQGGSEMDERTRATRVSFWFAEAERALSRFPALVDVRPID